jgi:hypothetical protein
MDKYLMLIEGWDDLLIEATNVNLKKQFWQ